jgi:hypothetical protein
MDRSAELNALELLLISHPRQFGLVTSVGASHLNHLGTLGV